MNDDDNPSPRMVFMVITVTLIIAVTIFACVGINLRHDEKMTRLRYEMIYGK